MDLSLTQLYSQQMQQAAAFCAQDHILDSPMGNAHVRARLCGSTVTFQVILDKERMTHIGWQINACLFGQAVSGLLCQYAIGLNILELREIYAHFQNLLKTGTPMPKKLTAYPDFEMLPWQVLDMLLPAHPLKARHKSALIAFEALSQACEAALGHKNSKTL